MIERHGEDVGGGGVKWRLICVFDKYAVHKKRKEKGVGGEEGGEGGEGEEEKRG